MGEGAARAATVAGAGAVHRVGPQEAGPARGVLSVRHSAGQGGRGARQGRRPGGPHSSAGGPWRRFEGRPGRRRRAGHPRPRIREGRARAAVQQGPTRQHARHRPYQDSAGSADAVLVPILTTRNEKEEREMKRERTLYYTLWTLFGRMKSSIDIFMGIYITIFLARIAACAIQRYKAEIITL